MAMAPSPPVLPRPEPPKRSNFIPRSIEDQIRYAQGAPHPQTYNPGIPQRYQSVPLGKISNAKVPHTLDHPARLGAYVPGPGQYATQDSRDFALPEGGRLNRMPPQDRIKLDEYPIPGPADHGIPNDPNRPRAVNGAFGKDPRHAEYIRQEVLRSRSLPAPGAHEVMEAFESQKPFCPEGGRLMHASKPVHYFDHAPRLTAANPPPGTYDLAGAVKSDKVIGNLVYRYESATMAESKAAVMRAVGDSNSAPGPGTYSLPDPPPLHEAPALKSRTFGHAMPHPFSYNCAPDLGQKYAPVRQQNSGDQIFGRDLKKGTRGSRPSSAGKSDRVPADDLGESVGPSSNYPPDPAVEWRSGGFAAAVRKTKSVGVLRPPLVEHVSVQEARERYKPMTRRHRSHSAVLPNASRKNNGHVPVSVRDDSKEYMRLKSGKAQLSAVLDSLQSVTIAALEPLDEEKLKSDALAGLKDKASERMRLEGVAEYQQQMVLDELPQILEERQKKHKPSQSKEDVSAFAESDEVENNDFS